MPNKTLKELRAAARTRGLRGYSKLTRAELEKLLSRNGGKITAALKPKKTRSQKSGAAIKRAPITTAASSTPPAAQPASAAAEPAPQTPPATEAPKWKWASEIHASAAEEEQVENAKYVTQLAGASAPRTEITGLDENIDQLPPITEPMLCLLPQKPGVMHGYWAIPSDAMPAARALKLRFGRIAEDRLEIIDEVPLTQERGHWYFHTDASADMGAVYLQLGYYEPDGRFVNALRRGIARIPNLHASEHTDRLWWVSEEQFRAMYRRAGGETRGPHLGMAGSGSSPGGAPSSERLAWPGGISSRR